MNICEICKSIPIDKLPSEEEPGFPHQPDLDSLEESAQECCLCRVIFLAASELAAIINNERTGKDANAGGQVQHSTAPSKPGDSASAKYQYVTNFGYHSNDDDGIYGGGPPGYTGPVHLDPREVFPTNDNIRPWLFGSWWTTGNGKPPGQLIGLGVRLGPGPKLEEGVGNSATEIGGLHLRGTSFRFRVEFDSPLAPIIPGRLRATNSASILAYSRAKQWIQQCNDHHQCVPQQGEVRLPKRVLDLGEGQRSPGVRLLETRGQSGRYIALSHCWGSSHRIQTTKATIQDHKRGMKFSALPQTFQDAVASARKFNIRYLWIDTLCIIQDDAADWEQESSMMGEIYSNAYLTLAASSSTDDSSGMFLDMDHRMDNVEYISSDALSHGRPGPSNVIPDTHIKEGQTKPMFAFTNKTAFFLFKSSDGESRIFLSPEWMPSSRKEEPLTYRIGEFGRSFDPLEGEPLSRRAWTTQERMLSPRTLHYGTDQMYWECKEALSAEDGAVFDPSCRSMPTLKRLSRDLKEASKGGLSGLLAMLKLRRDETLTYSDSSDVHNSLSYWSGPPPEKAWVSTWRVLIEEYTNRKLTREEDKLPALAGLAKIIHAETRSPYLAGHWRSSILETLCWKVQVYEPNHMCSDPEHDKLLPPPTKSKVRYPISYRAPSWSWASIDGSIDFPTYGGPRRCMAQVVDCEVVPNGKDPFGRVKSGWISILAPLVPLKPSPVEWLNRAKFPYRTPVSADVRGDTITGMAYFDVDPEYPCWALVLSVEHALILRWREADNRFIRIGAVDWYNAAKWDSVKKAHCAPASTPAASRGALVKSADQYLWKTVTIV